jgi:hypothetical protein
VVQSLLRCPRISMVPPVRGRQGRSSLGPCCRGRRWTTSTASRLRHRSSSDSTTPSFSARSFPVRGTGTTENERLGAQGTRMLVTIRDHGVNRFPRNAPWPGSQRRWTGIEPAGQGSPVPAALKAVEPTRCPDTSTDDRSGRAAVTRGRGTSRRPSGVADVTLDPPAVRAARARSREASAATVADAQRRSREEAP